MKTILLTPDGTAAARLAARALMTLGDALEVAAVRESGPIERVALLMARDRCKRMAIDCDAIAGGLL